MSFIRFSLNLSLVSRIGIGALVRTKLITVRGKNGNLKIKKPAKLEKGRHKFSSLVSVYNLN